MPRTTNQLARLCQLFRPCRASVPYGLAQRIDGGLHGGVGRAVHHQALVQLAQERLHGDGLRAIVSLRQALEEGDHLRADERLVADGLVEQEAGGAIEGL
eukprot:2993551-Alexandrium_andersonii.AAC.1